MWRRLGRTPLTFLGGSFYSINVLPPIWQTVTLFNPVVYLISGFRWSFFGTADVGLATGLATVWWMFRTGYRLKRQRRVPSQIRKPCQHLAEAF